MLLGKHEDLEKLVNKIAEQTKDLDLDLCETRDTKLDSKTYEKQIYEITQGLNLVEKRLSYGEHENKEMANFFLR